MMNLLRTSRNSAALRTSSCKIGNSLDFLGILYWLGFALAVLLLTPLLHADPVTVVATVTPDGALYNYSYTITDNLSAADNDVFLIDISVPAVPGSITKLTAPAGFKTAFDSGLGLISFLEDTGSFGSTPISGFSFDSAGAPGTGTFAASVLSLDDFSISAVDGATTTPGKDGPSGPSPVPEPSTFLLTASCAPLFEAFRRLKQRMNSAKIKKPLMRGFLLTLMPLASISAQSIHQDANANISDVYAFIGTKFNDSSVKVLNVIVNVHPFSNAGDALAYDRFSDDVLYSINIANPGTGALVSSYNFRFSPVSSAAGTFKNPSTILSYGRGTSLGAIQNVNDSAQNFTQTYSVTNVVASSATSTVLGSGLLVPPPNVGLRTTPQYNDGSGNPVSGSSTNSGLDTYTRETIYQTSGGNGEVVWAGPREDSAFGDFAGIGDLLEARILGSDGHGQTGNGVDTRAGMNVLTFAIQIPLSALPQIAYADSFTGTAHGVGVYASTSRQRITLRNTSADPTPSGPWIQVSRAANPYFADFFVGQKDKDNYSRSLPTGDSAFAMYALNPEMGVLFNAVFGVSFTVSNRTDLAAIFLPDVLRVDTTTGPVPLIGESGNRLSGIGGDTTGGKWSGWPNGRRLGDDVIDITFTSIASGPTYSSIFLLGDNVNRNHQNYNFVFPYAATPNAGPTKR